MPMRQQPLTTPGGEASQGCGPKQEKGPKSGALVQARPNSVVILWVLFRSVMPSSPPGCWQRGRTGLAVVACAVLWGVRWYGPFSLFQACWWSALSCGLDLNSSLCFATPVVGVECLK